MKVNAHLALAFLLVLTVPVTTISDDETLALVREEIYSLSDFGAFDWITCEKEGTTIRLQGFASQASLKVNAASGARSVPGIETIDNQIEVLPPSESDRRIRNRAYAAIYGHPILQRYAPRGHGSLTPGETRQARTFGLQTLPSSSGPHPIHVIVKHGHVILLGTVASLSDRDLVALQVRQFFDVFSVENKLKVR